MTKNSKQSAKCKNCGKIKYEHGFPTGFCKPYLNSGTFFQPETKSKSSGIKTPTDITVGSQEHRDGLIDRYEHNPSGRQTPDDTFALDKAMEHLNTKHNKNYLSSPQKFDFWELNDIKEAISIAIDEKEKKIGKMQVEHELCIRKREEEVERLKKELKTTVSWYNEIHKDWVDSIPKAKLREWFNKQMKQVTDEFNIATNTDNKTAKNKAEVLWMWRVQLDKGRKELLQNKEVKK